MLMTHGGVPRAARGIIMRGIGTASVTIGELREFAGFAPGEQRFIKRSLDIGLGRQDAFRLWARDEAEAAAIHDQYLAYRQLPHLRRLVREEDAAAGAGFDALVGGLIALTAADLRHECLATFSAYRFLYERLIGARARPWLPAAFCAAAALPQIRPERRKLLLRSISESAATATGWSAREPTFYPEWVEKALA